ncbi:inner membrane complex protein 1l, putative [Plasmodium malariae]|uniref:Inner membrane complex protein 1l, putative n=1 Tax=Plasmodium malariae TaxID=5858 RepID=A0A1C3KFD5_PLAMA|nr:inner membrane complex protein 1l, putative [Plasmodium malariae]
MELYCENSRLKKSRPVDSPFNVFNYNSDNPIYNRNVGKVFHWDPIITKECIRYINWLI